MGVIDEMKDAARKTSNSVVDAVENMVDSPKSPKELAKRLVEHLSHGEYAKIAEIVSDETRKYAKHTGMEDFAPVEEKLNDFRCAMEAIAGKMEEGDYGQVVESLREIETAVPESMAGITGIFKSLKGLLKDIIQVVEEYAKEGETSLEKKAPDFSKLQEVFEDYFNEMISK